MEELANKRIMVKANELAPNLTLEKAYEEYLAANTEQKLADVFAVVENKVGLIEDNEYDFEDGTAENVAARERTDKWFDIADRIRNDIFEILRSDGIEIPKNRQIIVLEPFMKRNGYRNGNGWWIKV